MLFLYKAIHIHENGNVILICIFIAVVQFLLGSSPAFVYYWPTFRNALSVPSVLHLQHGENSNLKYSLLFSMPLTAYMLQAVLGQGCWHNSQEVKLLYPEYKTKLQTLAVVLLLLLLLSVFTICLLEFRLLPLIMLAGILEYFLLLSL
jgi:hypothetical protein